MSDRYYEDYAVGEVIRGYAYTFTESAIIDFAFLNLGPTAAHGERKPLAVGVNHLAYTWKDVRELVDTFKRLKRFGVVPYRPIRHGPTLSMYYHDPDGNSLEFQADLMAMEAACAFMRTDAFAANPIGEAFDPDQLAARVDAGRPFNDLIFRSDQPQAKVVEPV